MPRTWKPSAALRLSAAVHAGAGVTLLAASDHWPWALAALGANQLILTAAGMLPRSTLLGPNLRRLPSAAAGRREIALTIDDGPDPEVTPRVLDLLDGAGVKASFFCIGRRARQSPVLCREIAERGHRVENHGDSHSSAFATFGPQRLHADIAAAQQTLADLSGHVPRFFRPPAGLRNPLLEPVLCRLDLRLASWTRRAFDTREGNPSRVFQRLTRRLAPGDILLLHDGHAARDAAGQSVILGVLPDLLRSIAAHDLQPVTLAAALS